MANGIYASDGSIRYTVVDGTTGTGLYAADGSVNVVVNDTTYSGLYHPCGAWRASTGTGVGLYDASGAYYLSSLLGVSGGALRGDVWIDFTTMVDGAPGLAGTGETLNLDYAGVGNGTVFNGAFVVTTESATYNSIQCREDIKSMFADVSFSDANDVVAIITTPGTGQLAVGASSCHLAFNPAGWVLSWYTQNTAGTITSTDEASGSFTAAAYGTKVRCGFEIVEGLGVYITVPDSRFGTRTSFVSAPETASRTNHTMMFEHYRNGGGTPGCKFYSVAANLFASPEAAGRTNLFTAPTDFTNAVWVKDGLGTPTVSSPGYQILETSATGFHWVYQNVASIPNSATRMCLRFKTKFIGEDWARIICYDGALSGAANQYRNLTTGAIGSGGGTTGTFTNQFTMDYPLSDGWHQVQLEFLTNPTASGVYAALGVVRAGDASTDQFTGDTAKGMLISEPYLFVRPT